MPTLDNHLVVKKCPHCQVDKPNLIQCAAFTTYDHRKVSKREWSAYRCQRCGGATLASANAVGGQVLEMYPKVEELDNAIPSRAKAYLDQAMDTLHAPAGSIMLSASSVDSMLKDKGYADGSLYSRIGKAVEDHLITNSMAEWAHEVRLDANDQRHADEEADLPTEQDAKRIVDFVVALAQFLYVLPSKVSKGIQEAKQS